jgi:ribonuclease HI
MVAASSRLKIFFDGGCRPNPGSMEIAVVMGGHVHISRDIGHGTGMDAEWLALIHALRLAKGFGTANIILLGDGAAVINQANGTVKARGANLLHLNEFRALRAESPAPRIRYIKRAQNLAGIALARLHPR